MNNRSILTILFAIVIALTCSNLLAQESINDFLNKQAELLRPSVNSKLAQKFLEAIPNLPNPPKQTVIYYDKGTKSVYTNTDDIKNGNIPENYKKYELDEKFFYFTKYGTPLAFIAPIEILGNNNFEITKDTKVLDYGFGSIGQLLGLQELGVKVSGIEVDPMLKELYKNYNDELNLKYGIFPRDKEIVKSLGNQYDLFISKNTLKKGYINPDVEVDKKYLLDLGVSQKQYLKSVYDLLKPGGYFMIYNLHGKLSKEDYKARNDGRSPFSRELFEKVGFNIIKHNEDHTYFAHDMGTAFGWDEKMDFEKHLFATYTLVKK